MLIKRSIKWMGVVVVAGSLVAPSAIFAQGMGGMSGMQGMGGMGGMGGMSGMGGGKGWWEFWK